MKNVWISACVARQLLGALAIQRFQRLVELHQLLLRLLRGRHVVGDADEADVFAARAPARLRFRAQPAPVAVAAPVSRLKRERLQGALAGHLLAQDALEIVGMQRLAPIEVHGLVERNAEKVLIGAIDEFAPAVEPR